MIVKVYKLIGSVPDITADYYLGDAVYLGGGDYSFNMPPTTEDYQFYYYAIDDAGNGAYSNVETYYNGINALTLRHNGETHFAFLRGNDGGLINLRWS